MRHSNPTQRRELGDTLADLADQTAIAIARAAALGIQPPAAVLLAERDLAGWARALHATGAARPRTPGTREVLLDRKSTRLNSSHVAISYAVFCLKKKK